MSPELLVEARRMVEERRAETKGVWPRAAAFLTRQAMEEAMRRLWLERAPGTQATPFTTQLLCLHEYLDPEIAERAAFAWGALSEACHHHGYSLPPTANNLLRWMDTVEALIVACEGAKGPR